MKITLKIPKKNTTKNNFLSILQKDRYGKKLIIEKVIIDKEKNIFGLKFSGVPDELVLGILKDNSWIYNRFLRIWEPASSSAKLQSEKLADLFIHDYKLASKI